jgi:hypothetical protein
MEVECIQIEGQRTVRSLRSLLKLSLKREGAGLSLGVDMAEAGKKERSRQ